jgi:sulfate transporter 4
LTYCSQGGFTSGAAITIGLGQVQYILGYSVKPTEVRMNLYLTQYFDRVNNLKWQEFIMVSEGVTSR